MNSCKSKKLDCELPQDDSLSNHEHKPNQTATKQIHHISIDKLFPHSFNARIYGEDENIDDLVEQIRHSQWIKPLVITKTGKIISGHRRWKAARRLGLTQVPAEIIQCADEAAEIEALLLENVYRKKNNEQRVREGMMWEVQVRKETRRQQQNAAIRTNIKLGRIAPQSQKELPKTAGVRSRDIVAAKIGMKGRTYAKAAKVIRHIDWETKNGDPEVARGLRNILNERSIDAAYRLVNSDPQKRKESITRYVHGDAHALSQRATHGCAKKNDHPPRESGLIEDNDHVHVAIRVKEVAMCKTPQNQSPQGKQSASHSTNMTNLMLRNCNSDKDNHKISNNHEGFQDQLNQLDAEQLREVARTLASYSPKNYCYGIIDQIHDFSIWQIEAIIKAICHHLSKEKLLSFISLMQ